MTMKAEQHSYQFTFKHEADCIYYQQQFHRLNGVHVTECAYHDQKKREAIG